MSKEDRSRDDREATTFWMDNDTKSLAKQKAHEIGTTMTELINKAVAYYLDNLTDIDPDIAMKELRKEIQDAPRISQIEKDLEVLKERIDSINQLETKIEGLKEDVSSIKGLINEDIIERTIRSMLKTQIAGQLAPTMDALESLISQFDKIEQMERDITKQ